MSFLLGLGLGLIVGAVSTTKNINQVIRKYLGFLGRAVKYKARRPQ